MTPFYTTRRVEFGDTDMAGIMHFANFFRFMEVAETDFLQARGLSVTWPEGELRYGFPRVSVSCEFSRPARFQDVLTIAVSVETIGRKSVTYRFDFRRGEEEIATGRITAVFCQSAAHGSMSSLEIPEAIRTKLLA